MKKTLLTLFTLCTVFQFTNAQEQARLSVAPLDSNVTCDKATLIPHTFNNNEFLVDSFTNKGGTSGFYSFIATAKSGKFKVSKNVSAFELYSACGHLVTEQQGYDRLILDNLVIGSKYILRFYNFVEYQNVKLRISAIANKKDDNAYYEPTNLNKVNPYYFNTTDYTTGRNVNWGTCPTTKADSNVINLFIKFTATSTSATLNLNLDNALLESTLGLMSGKYNATCKPIQKNTNLRTDTFTGLTIGTDYTVRIEIGGDAALGYARTSSANNASITLVGGTVSGIENDSQPTFSISPNPSNGSFTFVSDNNADLVIYDLLGTKAAEFKKVSSNQNIDLQLAKGIYLLNVSTEKGSKVEKLVIE